LTTIKYISVYIISKNMINFLNKKILFLIFSVIFSNIIYSADFETLYFTRLVFLEWRVFGEIKTQDYGEKIKNLEIATWNKEFPYLSRFTRIKKLLEFYFTDYGHIKPVNCYLKDGRRIRFRIKEGIHSGLDNEKIVKVVLDEDVYDDRFLVLPKGLEGEMEITKITSKRPLMKNGKIEAKITFLNGWDGTRIIFDNEFELANKPTLNPLFGGIGYLVAGIRGGLILFAGTYPEDIYIKNNKTFYIRTDKNIRLWGIGWK